MRSFPDLVKARRLVDLGLIAAQRVARRKGIRYDDLAFEACEREVEQPEGSPRNTPSEAPPRNAPEALESNLIGAWKERRPPRRPSLFPPRTAPRSTGAKAVIPALSRIKRAVIPSGVQGGSVVAELMP